MSINTLLTGQQFCATIPSNATSVVFCNEVAPTSVNLIDVSDAQDNGIVAWMDGTTYKVSTQNDENIYANVDCSAMFRDKKITSIDFQNLKTDNVEDMLNIFRDCGIVSLDLSSLNTSKLKSLKNAFSNCINLVTITFGDNFSTESVENMGFMFYGSSSLKELDLSSFNTKNVTYIKSAFNGCVNLTSVKFGDDFILDNATDVSYMFNNCSSLTELNLSHWRTKNATLMNAMFQNCNNLKTLDVENWDTSSCENMGHLLHYCNSLENFDASKWNVGKVKTFASMFSECEKLNYFSTKNWNTSSCETMQFMFYGCKNFKKLDCEDWDVRKVQSFDHFMAHSRMEEYDVSKWQVTSACENLNAIFHSTKETYIDVTGWDTSNVITFNQLCDGMYYLEKIDGLETWNTSKGVCFAEMFHGCGNLKEINLSSFDTRNANTGTPISSNKDVSYGLQDMFTGCSNLEKLSLGENFTRFGNGSIGSEYYAYFPTTVSGYWYTEDGTEYAPTGIPNLTYVVCYASPEIRDVAIWDRDSKKYIHLAAMRQYHDTLNADIDTKIDSLREEMEDIEEISPEEIQALFSVSVY